MGKYDSVLPALKPRPVEDAGWQAQVDAEKLQIEYREATMLAHLYAVARAEQDVKKAELSLVNVRVAALEQLLAESQDAGAEGWGQYGVAENALRLPDGSTVRVQAEPYGKVVDREAFRQWCVDNGYGGQLQLWPSTMNAIVKERLLHGDPEPAGVEAYSYKKIVFTGAKEK
jgi:hypothetical protein